MRARLAGRAGVGFIIPSYNFSIADGSLRDKLDLGSARASPAPRLNWRALVAQGAMAGLAER